MSFFEGEPELPQTHPDGVVADAKDFLEFLEGGVGMFFDVNLEFLRVEFAPMTPTGFGGQHPRLHGVQIAVNGAPTEIKAPGGLGFGAARLDEFHHPFPQVQCISFLKCYRTACSIQKKEPACAGSCPKFLELNSTAPVPPPSHDRQGSHPQRAQTKNRWLRCGFA
jgi:hypothetical protein